MSFFEFRIGHMSIDLRGRDRCMPEEFLDYTDICAISQECCRETMTECMGMEIFEYTRFHPIIFHHSCYKKARKAHIFVIQMDRFDIFFSKIMSDKKRSKVITSRFQIRSDRVSSNFCQVDNADFISLSAYCELHGFEIYIADIESSEF